MYIALDLFVLCIIFKRLFFFPVFHGRFNSFEFVFAKIFSRYCAFALNEFIILGVKLTCWKNTDFVKTDLFLLLTVDKSLNLCYYIFSKNMVVFYGKNYLFFKPKRWGW